MKKNRDAWILVLIPFVLWCVVLVLLAISFLTEIPSGRGVLYSTATIISISSIMIMPIPTIIVSILGILRASKEKNIPAIIIGSIALLVSIGFGVLNLTSLISIL